MFFTFEVNWGGIIPPYLQIKNLTMLKEIRKDIYTQAAYAKRVGKTRAWVNQQVKAGNLKTLTINGTVLVKES
jgi:hypothetical protein